MRTHARKIAKDASPETVFQSKEFRALAQFHLRDPRLRKYYREWSPLHRAVWQEDLVAVICLATKHSVKAVDTRGCTPLHLACLRKGSVLFFSNYCQKYCFKDGPHNCFPGRFGEAAVTARQITVALIEAGADPNAMASAPFTFTPMHCVANSGWVNVAHVLLEKGGSAFSRVQCSPFCWAGGIGFRESNTAMRELLKAHLSEAQKREIDDHHVRQGFKVLPW